FASEARVLGNGNAGFVTTRDSHFVLDGSPFLFNGFNAYWMMHLSADPSERYNDTT
ncbi:Mannan endo-1,4-beta-mannosidase 5, partial [Olea europaea subsp. europaea]